VTDPEARVVLSGEESCRIAGRERILKAHPLDDQEGEGSYSAPEYLSRREEGLTDDELPDCIGMNGRIGSRLVHDGVLGAIQNGEEADLLSVRIGGADVDSVFAKTLVDESRVYSVSDQSFSNLGFTVATQEEPRRTSVRYEIVKPELPTLAR